MLVHVCVGGCVRVCVCAFGRLCVCVCVYVTYLRCVYEPSEQVRERDVNILRLLRTHVEICATTFHEGVSGCTSEMTASHPDTVNTELK